MTVHGLPQAVHIFAQKSDKAIAASPENLAESKPYKDGRSFHKQDPQQKVGPAKPKPAECIRLEPDMPGLIVEHLSADAP